MNQILGKLKLNDLLEKIKKDPKKYGLILLGVIAVVVVLIILIIAPPKQDAQTPVSSEAIPDTNPFIGEWTYTTGEEFYGLVITFDFSEDGNVAVDAGGFLKADGTYSYEGNALSGDVTFNIVGVGEYGTGTYSYNVNGAQITLSNSANSITLVKKSELVNNEQTEVQ